MQITDSLELKASSRKLTKEGYLKATAALTKVGLQEYRLSDITGNANDTKIVKVLRPADVVFNDDTIDSAKLKPITLLHPQQMVDSDNHHKLSVGTIGENVHKLDDKRLGANIVITNKAIIDDILNNKFAQLSMGYTANFREEKGIFDGEPYEYAFDGAMTINHCAIVQKGRCGEDVSILDKKEDIMQIDEIKERMLTDGAFKEALKKAFHEVESAVEKTVDAVKETVKSAKAEVKAVEAEVKAVEAEVKAVEAKVEAEVKAVEAEVKAVEAKVEAEVKAVEAEVKAEVKAEVHEVAEEVAKVAEKVAAETAVNDTAMVNFVKVRVNLINKASRIIKDEQLDELSNRQILEKVFTDHCDKSDDYLMGMLDVTLSNHENAKKGLQAINDSYGAKNVYNKRYSALDIQKL